MFYDARKQAAGATLRADVCIVGAGPAGIALAREFDGRRCRVVVLESGGFASEESAQSLGAAGELDLPTGAAPLKSGRRFGGNANSWEIRTDFSRHSVRLTRLASEDFEARDWIADSGWPIRLAELGPYYERAQRVFRLEAGGYGPEDWDDPQRMQLPVPTGELETGIFQFGSRETFTRLYRRQLERSLNVSVYHHATALEIETDDAGGRATGVRAASRPGREIRIEADTVVLTGGGIACAQMLLLSDRVQKAGLGNRHDLVGRYYMDHPLVQGGDFVPADPGLISWMGLYDLHTMRDVPVMGHLQLTAAALARARTLQISMLLFPRERSDAVRRGFSPRQELAVQSASRMQGALRSGRLPKIGDLGRVLAGPDGIAKRIAHPITTPRTNLGRGGWSRLPRPDKAYQYFEVVHQVEQPPRRDNRITLSAQRDAFGSRKIAVHWRWHDEDMAETMRAQDIYAEALARSGLGRFDILRPEGRPQVRGYSTAHYMGLTRMHDDVRQGVVDAQCEVHDVANLFVASAGVFTTGGFANPTLTVVALALRIGDEIRRRRTRAETPVEVRALADH